MEESVPTMADLVEALFKNHLHPSGREFTLYEASLGMKGAVTPPQIHQIRKGKSKNPTRETLLAFCLFFGVEANYFFPELAGKELRKR